LLPHKGELVYRLIARCFAFTMGTPRARKLTDQYGKVDCSIRQHPPEKLELGPDERLARDLNHM